MLCDEAEAFANQDYVQQREVTIGLVSYNDIELLQIDNTFLTQTEKYIVTLLGKGLSRKDVCQVLEISRLALRAHIARIRKKL